MLIIQYTAAPLIIEAPMLLKSSRLELKTLPPSTAEQRRLLWGHPPIAHLQPRQDLDLLGSLCGPRPHCLQRCEYTCCGLLMWFLVLRKDHIGFFSPVRMSPVPNLFDDLGVLKSVFF